MRIVGGTWGGRTLFAPPGTATRPTSDSLRESIFNIVEHRFGHSLVHVLDLFAGTGALSFEALSRGAKTAVLMECDPKAIGSIRRNMVELGLGSDRVKIHSDDRIEGWGKVLKTQCLGFQPFDTIFCDPPYDKGLVAKALRNLELAQIPLAPEARLVVEVSSREKAPEAAGWVLEDERRRGTTGLLFYKRA